MFKKIILFLKQEYKQIVFLIIFATMVLLPLPYYVMVGGGTIEIIEKIDIEEETPLNGSYYFSYVKELRATPVTYLLTKIIPSFTLIEQKDVVYENENDDDYQNRNELYLESSKESAVYIAYNYANKKIIEKEEKKYIILVAEYANTNIKVGDEILAVNNKSIKNVEEYRTIVENSNIGDKLSLRILRDQKEKDAYIEVLEIDGKKITGISIMTNKTYETIPKIKLKFNENESGSSGGLMLALTIYDKLVDEDIAKGRKIVGTGTINNLGEVGEIGGIEYKLKGAINSDADIFIAPSGENFETVKKIVNEKKYDIKIIEAISFNQVLHELCKS